MKRTATAVTWSVAALLIATAMSGCSSSNKNSSSSPAAAATSASAAAADSAGVYGGTDSASASPSASGAITQATVSTMTVGSHGTILVDGKGHTLYLFMADTQKNKSTCTGACAVAWPPLLTSGKAKTANQAKSNLLGTASRSGGLTQVTYNGHPLYHYALDKKSGEALGQGLNAFGALWWVVSPAGKQITN
jgi:predicted lipoprotein with Yx(FWY)xxD motif